MPCVENWTLNPLHAIHNLFENTREDQDWHRGVENYFADKLTSNLHMIPSLNEVSLHDIRSASLVRFRCMVQDTFEPEYFLETYQIVNKQNGHKTFGTSMYSDVIECPDGFEFVESLENKTGCRQVLYCVSVPAETSWVKEKFKPKQSACFQDASTSKNTKRPFEEDMEQDESATSERNTTKRPKASAHSGVNISRTPLKKNHPLPNEDGPVCIIKVYDENKDFKVNEIYEFIGVLSVDPALSATYDSSTGDGIDEDHMEEDRAHHPPPSLVPRLHCISMLKLNHINPLVSCDSSSALDISNMAVNLRHDLISFLKHATFGDELTAEYLLLHLAARVHNRTGTMAVGKLALNIANIPPGSRYPNLLSQLIEQLVTKAYYLPMSLENMNKLKFIPKKNYSSNRLDAGLLQLSDGTHLIVDETALKPGQLDTNGVKNVQALSALVKFQKIDYDFQFHPVTFYHDVSTLVLSEGKSMLPCDCQVCLKPEIPIPTDLESYFKQLVVPLDLMNKFRIYLTCARLADYELSDSMMKNIEDDFVAARRVDENKMSADDLHLRLVLARLCSTTSGQEKLAFDVWQRLERLENERKARIK
ncbi:unnamed protein product [Clavelina lepadiformis]|uniref:Mini-chromosome maintenance complex-binding protein n=1 Tax=Clavelina lepadiformis TaxID=159417 RepID=A0ABP0GDV9_CLALP